MQHTGIIGAYDILQKLAHLKLNSRKISFAHNFFLGCPVVLKFQNDEAAEIKVVDKLNFVRYEFRRDKIHCNTTLGPSNHRYGLSQCLPQLVYTLTIGVFIAVRRNKQLAMQ